MRQIIFIFYILFFFQNLKAQTAADYYNLAIEQSKKEQYSQAIENLDKSIALAPKVAQSYAIRAFSKSKLNYSLQAIEDFDKALYLNGQDLWSLHQRATIKYQMGFFKDAIKDFNYCVAAQPQNYLNYLFLAEAKLNTLKSNVGESKPFSFYEIASDISKAIALNPSMAMLYRLRGQVILDSLHSTQRIPLQQDIEKICVDWQKAIQLGDAEAKKLSDNLCGKAMFDYMAEKIFLFAEQKRIEQDNKQALNVYNQIIQSGLIGSPYFLKSMMRVAEINIENREFQQAIQYLSNILNLRNTDNAILQKVLYQRGWLYVQMQNFQKALDDFDSAIVLGYDNSWIYYEKGNIHHLLADKKAACEAWTLSLERGSKKAEEMLIKYCNYKIRGKK